jgi:hypothetical protein
VSVDAVDTVDTVDAADLRRSVAGLLGFAAASEEGLLAAVRFRGVGSSVAGGADGPGSWGAVPVVAHNNHFKDQQAERLRAVLAGREPPSFGEIDHSSAFSEYRTQALDQVLPGCRRVTAELVDGTWAVSDSDLLDPGRHSWLRGRMLWLQIVVRGMSETTTWGTAIPLARWRCTRTRWRRHGTWARRRRPWAWLCTALRVLEARVGRLEEAASSLASAIAANGDLRANAGRDPDLAGIPDRVNPC